MKEIWKDVVGWEGVYQISNFGVVRTVLHKVTGKRRTFFVKNLIRKQSVDKDGYARVHLRHNGKSANVCVHRMVAQAFIPNPLGLPMINHKDEDKLNNFVENLEWCDATYNNNYGERSKKASESLINRDDMSKKVTQYDECGTFIENFPSLKEIKRRFGYDPTFIRNACNGRYKQAYGYIWKFDK